MTDFDKEFNMLSEWLKYRIDWYTKDIKYKSWLNNRHKSYNSNVYMHWEASYYPNCLTLEEWKQFNQTK